MGRMRGLAATLVASIAVLVTAGLGHAAIYYHVDEEGVYHFTNAPSKPYFRILPAFGLPKDVNLTTGPYADLINRTAREHGIEPNLIKALIRVESNFNPGAVSRKGAQGLMQLMPATAANHAVADAFDPGQNVAGGVRYLRKLLDLFGGDQRLALAAYNAGENAVLRYNGVPPYRETQQYVRKVLDLYRSRNFDPPAPAKKPAAPSQTVREVVYPKDSAGGVYRSLDREGHVIYTNAPR
jgi:soluble lytic murein transglycosylase